MCACLKEEKKKKQRSVGFLRREKPENAKMSYCTSQPTKWSQVRKRNQAT